MGAGKKIFVAVVALGAVAYTIGALEKKAKREGKGIKDVAKESVNKAIDDVKTGKVIDDSKEFIARTYDDIKTGKIIDDAKDTFDKAKENITSGRIVDDANDMIENVKDGVVNLFRGDEDEVEELEEDVESFIKDKDDEY